MLSSGSHEQFEFSVGTRNRARVGLQGGYLVRPALRDQPGPNPGPARPEDRTGTPNFLCLLDFLGGRRTGRSPFYIAALHMTDLRCRFLGSSPPPSPPTPKNRTKTHNLGVPARSSGLAGPGFGPGSAHSASCTKYHPRAPTLAPFSWPNGEFKLSVRPRAHQK